MTELKQKKICKENGCERESYCRGRCRRHYEQDLRNNNPKFAERQRQNSRDWHQKNKEKANKSRKEWTEQNKNNPDVIRKKRNRHLKYKYGITTEDYEIMLEEQEGKCKLCYNPPSKKRLHVDHDHETGRVRGLLCAVCNWYLAKVADRTYDTGMQQIA